jgi:hypothetical protein
MRADCGSVSSGVRRGTRRRTMNEADHLLVARVVAAIADRTDAQSAALAAALAARWSPPGPSRPGRTRVAAPLDAQARAFPTPDVHVRVGQLPRL